MMMVVVISISGAVWRAICYIIKFSKRIIILCATVKALVLPSAYSSLKKPIQ